MLSYLSQLVPYLSTLHDIQWQYPPVGPWCKSIKNRKTIVGSQYELLPVSSSNCINQKLLRHLNIPSLLSLWLMSQCPFTPDLYYKISSFLTYGPKPFHSWVIFQGLYPKSPSLLSYVPRPPHSCLILQSHPSFLAYTPRVIHSWFIMSPHRWHIFQGPFILGLCPKALSLLAYVARSLLSCLISQGPFTLGLCPKAPPLLAYVAKPFLSCLMSQGPFTLGLCPKAPLLLAYVAKPLLSCLMSQSPFIHGLCPKAPPLLDYVPRPLHSLLMSQGPFICGLCSKSLSPVPYILDIGTLAYSGITILLFLKISGTTKFAQTSMGIDNVKTQLDSLNQT